MDFQGASDPEKVFDRTANLENTQIISYRVDPVEKWCVLIGIAQGAPERYGGLLIPLAAHILLHDVQLDPHVPPRLVIQAGHTPSSYHSCTITIAGRSW